MGKNTRKKQEANLAAEQRIEDALAATKNSGKTYRGVVDATSIMPRYIIGHIRTRGIRDHVHWTYKGKSKKIEKQRIELIRHVFARYPVPSFLEDAFISEDQQLFKDFGNWYFAVAQGESLYKTCTRGILTKKETHFVLQAPENLAPREAVWWAKSMAIVEDVGLAYRIAQSCIARRTYTSEFACDVHRFFVNNPVPLEEIQNLHDYIMAQVEGQANDWSIKKRSLEAIRRQSEVWHRDMAKMRSIGGGSWEGLDIAPWKYKTGKPNPDPKKSTEKEWVLFEILTGNDLAKEGNAMRHCVAGYKHRCVSGKTGIFTLRSNTMLKTGQRHLTIEVVNQHKTLTVTQVRGLANRMPRPQEQEILNRWAAARGLLVRNHRW